MNQSGCGHSFHATGYFDLVSFGFVNFLFFSEEVLVCNISQSSVAKVHKGNQESKTYCDTLCTLNDPLGRSWGGLPMPQHNIIHIRTG